MRFIDFCSAIKRVFEKQNEADPRNPTLDVNKFFISELNKLQCNDEADESLKMTRASILFEGFYRHMACTSPFVANINRDVHHPEQREEALQSLEKTHLKKALINLRTHQWKAHFGTPTIPFLLTYKNQIDKAKQLFDEFPSLDASESNAPWFIDKETGCMTDIENNIIADPTSVSRVPAPPSREMMGLFTKTHNPFGGYTTAACDPISLKFIEHAATTAANGGRVLEIGAAFGTATLEALAKGATVFCNDIDVENLAVVRKRFSEMTDDTTAPITGDSNKLILIPGSLPEELIGLPPKFFDAILISRVLHFFPGAKIEESLALLAGLLTNGGKIYIVCETPYLKNWQRFIPEFHNRVERGIEWPGEIVNPADYERSGRAAALPKFVHWITKEILERSLLRTGFSVEESTYINRKDQFPDDLLLPEYGKESVGAIGRIPPTKLPIGRNI